MSMANAIAVAHQLGGICIAAHIDRCKTGFDMIVEGFPSWKKDVLCSPGLYGLECDEVATLSWYSEEDDTTPIGIERRKLCETR